jgi:YebC/PmpR family DNA-binding regulatory protein
MSGHSHWATIKRAKGAVDAKRGKLFSKMSRAIIIAARHGGGDPDANLKLRYAIDKAREVSMPKDNIDRAIKRGTGETEGLTFEEIQYEGYGPGGSAILVDVLTDNRNRISSEIRKLFDRSGGKMGSPGCVAYLFGRKGVLRVETKTIDEDSLMSIALDAGAEDMKRIESHYVITTDPALFNQVKETLEKAGVVLLSADLTQLAKTPVDCDLETGKKVVRLLDALEDNDDVQFVHSNVNISEEMVANAD